MISFTVLNKDGIEEISKPYMECPFFEELTDILTDMLEVSDGVTEVAVCLISDTLLFRIYDGGEYLFPCPIGLLDGWDFKSACLALAEYTVKELIPLRLTDVPREELASLSRIFPHIDATAYSDDEDTFFVKVNNECDMLDVFPTFEGERISLGRITEECGGAYANLCRDRELNRFWGYDVSEDMPNAPDEYFLSVVDNEFRDGVSLTLGVFYGGEFIGEAVVYNFDYLGGASIGVRLLPEFHGHGFGGESVESLISLCRDIGLSVVRAEVLVDNRCSVKMTARYMDEVKREQSKVYFTKTL